MRPYVIYLFCILLTTPIAFAGSNGDPPHHQKKFVPPVDWAKIDWKKKAPTTSHQADIYSPKNNHPAIFIPVRRASAPIQKSKSKTVAPLSSTSRCPPVTTTHQIIDLQSRRHNSAPILRLRLGSRPEIIIPPPQQLLLSTSSTAATTNRALESSQEFVAPPIDYFDPRFAPASTPEELKKCGITRSSITEEFKHIIEEAHDEHLRENREEHGLLTCSLCMETFDSLDALQSHLRDHL